MTYKLPYRIYKFFFIEDNTRRKLKLPDSGATKRMHTRGGPSGKPGAPTT